MSLQEAHIALKSMEVKDFSLQGLSLDVFGDRSGAGFEARLRLDELVYSRTRAKDLQGDFKVRLGSIVIDGVGAALFGGTVSGSGVLIIDEKASRLDLKVSLRDIHMEDLMKALELEKRVDASGVFEGPVNIGLKAGELDILEGELRNRGAGKFIITDVSLLAGNLSQKSAANIVVENLRNYRYDIGYIKIHNVGRDIKIGIFLKGPAGERNVEIMWHRQKD